MTALLRPMAPTAPAAILCGDPARALAIAQDLLEHPRMSNHYRGLWGYHGVTALGRELTVQATGIGGPSACAVLSELAGLGVRSAIRVGTCHGAADGPTVGAAVVAERIVCRDGASAGLGVEPGAELTPTPELRAGLERQLDGATTLLSVDHLEPAPAKRPAGAAWDLQSAGLAALGARLGLDLAVAVLVAVGRGGRLEDDPLEAGSLRAARAAANALAPTRPQSRLEVEA